MPELHDQVPTREKVLIIGAGPAGLAAAAALQALEVPFDMVDRAAHVGGIWDPEREDSPVWPALEMVSSRRFTQYEDLLQPVSYPEFLDPGRMGRYLRAYAARHHLTDHFRPRVEVRYARPYEDGVWQVELSTGEIHVYGAVISAHGISETPHRPGWAADVPSSTRVITAKEWTGPDGLEGQRVLVVGSGQSAADIAVDASRRALEVSWSARNGHWVVPREIAGTPGDVLAVREPAALGGLNEKIARAVVTRAAGDPAAAGLPAPSSGLLEDSVIISDHVLDRVREGRITPVPEVLGVEDGALRLAGRSQLHAPGDLIVLATGYETSAGHLPEGVVPRTADGDLDLFLGAFPRGRDDLAVLGQQRVSGGVLPLLVEQADVAAYVLKARRDGDEAALEQFRRLRAGSDASVPAVAASESQGGLRGAVSSVLGAARRGSSPAAAQRPTRAGEHLVPFADREDALARLRTVRAIFED